MHLCRTDDRKVNRLVTVNLAYCRKNAESTKEKSRGRCFRLVSDQGPFAC